MKKYILLLMIFLFSLSAAAADNFTISIEPIKDSIALNGQAEFQIRINNHLQEIEEFIIYSPEVKWTVEQIVLKVYPESTSAKTFLVTPTKYLTAPGLYGIKLNVKRKKTSRIIHEELLLINVGKAETDYIPTIKTEIDMLEKIDPREPATISINLENANPLNLTNLILRISSDLPAFNREQKFALAGFEKKVLEFSFDIPAIQQPKQYKISFDILKDGEVIESAETQTIEIIPLMPEFKSEIKKSGWLFKTIREVTYASDSNVRNKQIVKYPVGWFAKIFTKTEPKSETIKEDGQRFLAWDIELGPEESATVRITTNYRLIIYIIIVIIIAVLLYIKYQSPVVIRKSVTDISVEEGGISRFKVMIDISNRSSKELKNISVVDIVPNIADIEKQFIEGTLKPSRVLKHRTKGSILRWKLAELAPGEERLISYDIKSKLSIIGSFRLPRAQIKFLKDDKEHIVRSNIMRISA